MGLGQRERPCDAAQWPSLCASLRREPPPAAFVDAGRGRGGAPDPRPRLGSFPEDDFVRDGIVIGHESANERARLEAQDFGPDQITVRRNASPPVFKLRNERVILGSHALGHFALRQAAFLPQFTQPSPRFIAQFLCELGRPPLRVGIHYGFPLSWPLRHQQSSPLRYQQSSCQLIQSLVITIVGPYDQVMAALRTEIVRDSRKPDRASVRTAPATRCVAYLSLRRAGRNSYNKECLAPKGTHVCSLEVLS